MTQDTYTIDLVDHVEELQEDLESLEERADEIVERAGEIEDEEGYVPSEVREEYESVDQQYQRLEGAIEKARDTIEEYSGSEWLVQELTGGAIVQCRDTVSRRAGNGELPDGALQIELCRKAVVDVPPGAPEDPAELPPNVMQYLFREVEAINTGRSSEGLGPLEERLDKSSS